MTIKEFKTNPDPLKACAIYNQLEINNEIIMLLDARLTAAGRASGNVTVEFIAHHHSGRGLSIEMPPHIMKGYGIDVSYFTVHNSEIVFDEKLNTLSICNDSHKFDLTF